MAKTIIIKLSKLKLNPENPQKFKDLSKLENSLKEFPEMLKLRPLIYDPKTMYVLGGNKRLICLQNLGYKEIPKNWTLAADDITEEQKKRFVIADNVGFGEWDFDKLNEFWDYMLNGTLEQFLNKAVYIREYTKLRDKKNTKDFINFTNQKLKL